MRAAELLALALAAAASASGLRAEPSTRPQSAGPTHAGIASSQTSTQPAGKLAEIIRTIRQSHDPHEAISAYADGCTIDRLNVELQDAYLRRMLEFGQVKVAYYPAQALSLMQDDNALAWGVLAYVSATQNKLAEALEPAVRAASLAGDNPSVVRNAAQLIAWYEAQRPPPNIPEASRGRLETVKRELGSRELFALPYKKVQAVFAERDAEAETIRAKIAAVESEGRSARQSAEELDGTLRSLDEEVRTRQRDIRGMRGEINRLEEEEPNAIIRSRRRQILNGRIRQEEWAIREAENKARQARGQGEQAIAQMRRKAGEFKQLQDQLDKLLGQPIADLFWEPPAVEGVVTPETALPPPRSAPSSGPAEPQTEAEKRLALARLYLDHGMPEKAAGILRAVAADYPDTRAAEQAHALLKQFKLPPPEPQR